ncbi:DUF3467 domain-containing protein [Candidatus Dojkabacteria bacterium]|uniref:DUF3467 domain-containing protein n=1 Tax=Candidatus Dojkabacteria bacterium TaxID=2099670 RepID=A0A955L3U7_9BACT|nr:DUF3467 domain-containing protein [Candidatus Dojkabacteria bacterium]
MDKQGSVVVRNESTSSEGHEARINMHPDMPVLYSDSVFLNTNKHGIIFNFAQPLANNDQKVVARIGMSLEHARKLVEVLEKELKKVEE